MSWPRCGTRRPLEAGVMARTFSASTSTPVGAPSVILMKLPNRRRGASQWGASAPPAAAGGLWSGRITRERSPASPAPRTDPPALRSQRRRPVSTCIYEAKGGARARGCDAAHEGGRTLGQRIDDAGPLEIPPELLLLRVRALRCAGGCALAYDPPGSTLQPRPHLEGSAVQKAGGHGSGTAAQTLAGAPFLPVRWSTRPPAAASGRVRARPPSSPVRHPSI